MSKVPCVDFGGSGNHQLVWDIARRLMMSLDDRCLLL